MKLVRYGEKDRERPGVLDERGAVRDLTGVLPDPGSPALDAPSLARIASVLRAGRLPEVRTPVRLGPCVGAVSKIICVGLNYHEHIREVGATVPAEPVLFMKAPSSLAGPYDDVHIPVGSVATDWEVELGVVIGERTSRVTPEQALDHVAGYCIVNDISERDWQLKGTGQWMKGKSADTFAPIGPWLVTRDEVPDPQRLSLQLSLNGELQQRGNTADMVFDVRFLVSYISRFTTLLPGDIISTGTPPGVGMGKKPQRYLVPGDVMELAIDGLGVQKQRVIAAPA